MGGLEYPPYGLMKDVYVKIMPQEINVIDTYHQDVDVSSFLHIQNDLDIADARMFVINYIWKDDDYPLNKIPSKIELDIFDEKFSNMSNLEKIDKITVLMDHGVDSKAYLFVASTSNDKLVI